MSPLPRPVLAVVEWLKGAPGWLGGALAGAQAAALSLALVLIPAWVIVAGAPAPEGASGPDWGAATSAAVRLWLLSFGVPWDIEGVPITLPPLGLTALSALMMVALARRFASKTWTSWLCAVGAFAGLVAFVTTLTWAGAEDTSERAARAAVVAVVLGAPAAALGIWRAHGATLAWVGRVPSAVRAGLRMGIALVGVQMFLAAAVGAVWAVAGRHEVAQTATELEADAAGAVALAAVETLYTPTLTVWFMAWNAGVGFDVGAAHFSPANLVAAPLPGIPLLGALPSAAGGVLLWAPVLIVVAAVAVRLALRSRLPQGMARAATLSIGVASAALVTAVLGVWATGAIGPGTLTTTGANVAALVSVSTLWATVGVVLGEGMDRLAVTLGFARDPHKRVRPAVTKPAAAATDG